MKKQDIINKEAIAEQLKALAPSVSTNDRMEWGAKNRVSLSTINRYFRGEVASLIIGRQLLNDFIKYKSLTAA